jgi:predicted enzyme related to lactoylglutathione lyase
MPNPGSFVWYELMTSDAKGAEKFYRDVVGWGAQPAGMVPGMDYTLLTVDDAPAAGLMTTPAEAAAMGAKPGWIGYVGVESVDKAAAKLKELGGTVHKPPADIPNVGRFAIVGDPHGAIFALFKGEGPEPEPPEPGTPGHTGWHELYSGDYEAAFRFYSTMFGWTKAEALDMGPMGTYQLFAHDGVPIGGMMNKPPQVPKPSWTYYFNVDSTAAAIERVKRGGGQITMGPMQVPGGSWIAMGIDPQQASFAVVSRGE